MLNKHIITTQLLEQLPAVHKQEHSQALKQWWYNLRATGGLRLSQQGYTMFNIMEIQRWEHNLDSTIINAGMLIVLDKKLTCPYYIAPGKKPKLVMFGSKETMMLKLYGDIGQFLTMLSRQ